MSSRRQLLSHIGQLLVFILLPIDPTLLQFFLELRLLVLL